MATEADLIQKFKDLNIPVGADFEELIHAAFAGTNLADIVNSYDSRIAMVEDNLDTTKGSIQANTNAIEKNANAIKNNTSNITTKADDSKVVHNTGTEEIGGQKTFDVAPIDKKTGNPYITKDGVPSVTSTLADMTKDANFTGKLQKSGIDVATKSDVTTAVSTATANMVDSTKATNFTAGLQSGGVDVATAADLKSLEDSAWRVLTGSSDFLSPFTLLYRIHDDQKYMDAVIGGTVNDSNSVGGKTVVDLTQLVEKITSLSGSIVTNISSNYPSELAFSGAKIVTPKNETFTINAICSTTGTNNDTFFKISYSKLI